MKECLLISEPPLQVLPSLAKAIGLNEAIALQQLHWLLKDERNGAIHDGRKWIYNTIPQWQKFFPFWCERTLRQIFQNLENMFLIETCQPEGWQSRRTYYRINEGGISKLTIENFAHSSQAAELTDWNSSQAAELTASKAADLAASPIVTKNTQRKHPLSPTVVNGNGHKETMAARDTEQAERSEAQPLPQLRAAPLPLKEPRRDRAASESELREFCKSIGVEADAKYLWLKWEENGWTRGGKKIKDWRMTIRSWKEGRFLPSQKNPVQSKPQSPAGRMW